MLARRKTMLGLAFSGRSIVAAQVAPAAGRMTLVGGAVLSLPEGAPDDATATGQALRELLREHHLQVRRCVIGLEAGWLTAREKPLPPCPLDALADVVSLAIQREFASAEGLVFDFLPPVDASVEAPALLVAASEAKLAWAVAVAKAAGLTVAAVGASSLALLAGGNLAGDCSRTMLSLYEDRCELLVADASVRALRRLHAPDATSPEQLAMDVRRVGALLPASQGGCELAVWNLAGLDDAWPDALAGRLGMPARVCHLDHDLAGLDVPAGTDARLAPAAALAMQPAPDARMVDWLHSRLAPPRRALLGGRLRWAVAAGVLAVLAGAWFAADWWASAGQVARLGDQLDRIAPNVQQAQEVVDRVSLARGWYDRRPAVLECLLSLANVFPQEGSIWATNLTIRDQKVLLTGKCNDEQAVLALLDRLKARPEFTQIKPIYIRQAGAKSRDLAFALSFEYPGIQ
jgi:hypothetical protein